MSLTRKNNNYIRGSELKVNGNEHAILSPVCASFNIYCSLWVFSALRSLTHCFWCAHVVLETHSVDVYIVYLEKYLGRQSIWRDILFEGSGFSHPYIQKSMYKNQFIIFVKHPDLFIIFRFLMLGSFSLLLLSLLKKTTSTNIFGPHLLERKHESYVSLEYSIF